MTDTISLIFGGDTSVGEDSARYLEGVTNLLSSADLRMLQLEEPYTRELLPEAGPHKLTSVLDPLVGKVDLVTLSGNHFYDYGDMGVRDTLDWCDEHAIARCGGGMNAAEAALPAFVEARGIRVGVLAWNCIGSKYTFAREDRAGTNGLEFTRAWVEDAVDQHSREARIEWDIWALREPAEKQGLFWGRNYPEPTALMRMQDDIRAAKAQCDILIAYFHKGYVHQPVVVADWERLVARMAVDAGADCVIGTHSHIAHGVEFYKGAPIYHGLNNFVMWTPQLSPQFKGAIPGGKDSVNAEWIAARVKRFGFVPDPDYPTYPFHPESVHCPVAKLIIGRDANGVARIQQARMVLMQVEKSGIPYVHGQDAKGRETFDYLQRITREAGLNARLVWDGDEVLLTSD